MWWFWIIYRLGKTPEARRFNKRKPQDDPGYKRYQVMRDRLAQLRRDEGGLPLGAELAGLAITLGTGSALAVSSAYLFKFYFAVEKICQPLCETLKSNVSDVAACITGFGAFIFLMASLLWIATIIADRRQVRIKRRVIRRVGRDEIREARVKARAERERQEAAKDGINKYPREKV